MRILSAIVAAVLFAAGVAAAYQVFGERDVMGKMLIANEPLELVSISSGHKMMVNSRTFAAVLCFAPLALVLTGAVLFNFTPRKSEETSGRSL